MTNSSVTSHNRGEFTVDLNNKMLRLRLKLQLFK
jgi:hypothetical protein